MFQLALIHDQLQLYGTKSSNSATRGLAERCLFQN